jgi:hypothetical protein
MVLRTILILLGALMALRAHAETRLHELPPENPEEVAGAVAAALQANCANREINCRAQALPNGQLLVEAPADAQTEVAAVLQAIAQRSQASSGPVRTTLHYWAVLGVAGEPDSDQASLRPLQPALTQLEQLSGPLGFTIVDRVTLTIVPYGRAGISGRRAGLNVNQNTNQVSESEMSASLALTYTSLGAGANAQIAEEVSMSVEMTLQRGEFLVLGERKLSAEDGRSMFYVVHWPEND